MQSSGSKYTHTETYITISRNKDILTNVNVGDTIVDMGFSSFSFSINIAKNFSKHILILSCSDGIHGCYFDLKYNTSKFNEEEILLGPGLHIRVNKIHVNGLYTYYESELYETKTERIEPQQTTLYDRYINNICNLMDTYPTEAISIGKFVTACENVSTLRDLYSQFLADGMLCFKYEFKLLYNLIKELLIIPEKKITLILCDMSSLQKDVSMPIKCICYNNSTTMLTKL